LSGEVIFDTAGVNPAQGLVELPQNLVDPNALIATLGIVELLAPR
jgi:large exoprotein involved in heme utilization and adhesion